MSLFRVDSADFLLADVGRGNPVGDFEHGFRAPVPPRDPGGQTKAQEESGGETVEAEVCGVEGRRVTGRADRGPNVGNELGMGIYVHI